MRAIIATKSGRARGAAGAPAAGCEEGVRYPLPPVQPVRRDPRVPISAQLGGHISRGEPHRAPLPPPRRERSGRPGRAPRGGK